LLSFAALTSTVSLLEVPVAYVVDEFKVKRPPAVWIIALVIFLVGIPSMLSNGYSTFFSEFVTYPSGETKNFMDFVENIASDTFLPLGGLLITIFGAYIWKKSSLDDEIEQGYPGYKTSFVKKYLDITLLYFCPIILGLIFLFTVTSKFLGIDLLSFLG
jgi:NSS family neurotransmitter:Na+ symporter